MSRQVVILHGWSDSSESFRGLAKYLKVHGRATVPIFLGDYASLRDDVKIADVVKRMNELVVEFQAAGKLAKNFDMIVHSTGGLVVRHWISTYFQNRPCPVKNLVMLAPANFGSKLAHQGRSLLGRAFKGRNTGFETGEEMLCALELASQYQWKLAQRDLFVPEGQEDAPALYGKDKVRAFVIVGTIGYPELMAQLLNEEGSDGTVRVAAANMNVQGKTVDFSGRPENLENPEIRSWQKRGGDSSLIPMAVLPDRNHGDIIKPDEPGASSDPQLQRQLGDLILEALGATPAKYKNIAERWRGICLKTRELVKADGEAMGTLFPDYRPSRECFHEYFQVVVRVEDEFGEPIPDYFLTFTGKPTSKILKFITGEQDSAGFFHSEVLEHTHVYQAGNEYRSFFIDRYDMMRKDGFYDQIKAGQTKELAFAITAADPGERIAYFTHDPKHRGVVLVHRKEQGNRWLKRHCTHFIRVIVPRAANKAKNKQIFRLGKA